MLEHGHKEFYGERGRHVGDAGPWYCTLLVQSTVLQRLVEKYKSCQQQSLSCKYLGNFHNFCTFSYFIQHKNYEYIDYKLLVTLWWERQLFLNKYKLLILIYHSSIFYISSCRLICTSAYAEIAEIMFNRTVPLKPNENQLRKNIKKQTHIPWCHYIIAEVAA